MSELTLLRPWWLAAAPALLALLWLLDRRRSDRDWSAVCDPPLLQVELPPPGYARASEGSLAAAVEGLSALVGEFEKPRYFHYDPDICAHGRSGQVGCTRCLDACPAGAIASIGEQVEVDPHLCQGGGACATACPTGAIEYAYPKAADQCTALAGLLDGYAARGGQGPVLLWHDGEAGLDAAEGCCAALSEQAIHLSGGGFNPWRRDIPLECVRKVELTSDIAGRSIGVRALHLYLGGADERWLILGDASPWMDRIDTAIRGRRAA